MDSTEKSVGRLDDEQQTLDGNQLEELEELEEQKLKSKYPKGLSSGHSVFLQRRLHKRQKFFDSGDYQMAKQIGVEQLLTDKAITGELIPTPETVPVRKYSIIQPCKYPLTK